ncbi:MAG: uroporphyrinogen decarboxylase family protein [Phycisphaerae bacterium]|jgi:uroporphyrinogen decarboxylase
MTPKDRFTAAINHKIPDRVPLGFAGINDEIDRRLKKHFGLADSDNDGLLESLGIDSRMVFPTYTGARLHYDLGDIKADPLWGWRTRLIKNDSGSYWDYCDFPLKNATLEDVEAWPLPNPDDFDYDGLIQQCEKYAKYCVIFGSPSMAEVLNSTSCLRTMEQVLVDLITDDEVGLRLIDRKNEATYGIMERVLEKVGDRIDLIWTGEDLGTQHSPIISKELFRKHFRPRHQKYIDLAKKYNIPVMIHSCGSSSWAFNDFIDMGIRVVDTLQPEARDMAPCYLKQNFGDKLSFHGCISTAGPLAYGSVDDVVKNVQDTLNVMMPNGGYVMAPTHQIQDNNPVENIVAAYETVRKYGVYR